MDCPACKRTVTGENEYTVARALLEHMTETPDDDHIKHFSEQLEKLDRVFTFAATVAKDDSGIRAAMYDKCADFSTRLETIWLYSVSHASVVFDAITDLILDCGDEKRVTEVNKARRLRKNLRESLTVAKRPWR